MAARPKTSIIAAGLLIFLLVLGAILFVASRVRSLYGNSLSEYTPPQNDSSASQGTRIEKITIQRPGEERCIEVTPDGIVRVFSVCGETLDEAHRLTSTRHINKLFTLLHGNAWRRFLTRTSDEDIEITLETSGGTVTVYIPPTDDETEDIIETIEDIEEQIPDPTPTLSAGGPTPTIPIGPTTPPLPSITPGGPTLTPTPTIIAANPFTCDFATGGSKKPVPVSNTVCSTDPQ